jgi:hypothetical protein
VAKGIFDKVCFYFGGGKHIYTFMLGVSSVPKTLVMVPSYGSFFKKKKLKKIVGN